jgi:hypothetical protein
MADRDSVENLYPSTNPNAVADRYPLCAPFLVNHWRIIFLEVVTATDNIDVRSNQHIIADGALARRKYLAVRPNIAILPDRYIAILTIDYCVSSDEYSISNIDAMVVSSFRVKDDRIISDDPSANANFVGVPKHNIRAENDSAPAGVK